MLVFRFMSETQVVHKFTIACEKVLYFLHESRSRSQPNRQSRTPSPAAIDHGKSRDSTNASTSGWAPGVSFARRCFLQKRRYAAVWTELGRLHIILRVTPGVEVFSPAAQRGRPYRLHEPSLQPRLISRPREVVPSERQRQLYQDHCKGTRVPVQDR